MAPKLPPPAKTKAVFAGPAWLDRDKAAGAPGLEAKGHATFGGVIAAENVVASSTLVVIIVIPGWSEGPGNDGLKGTASAFDERLLDHKMAGLAVAAFEKAARLEHLAQLFQHARAAAHHDPVAADIQRRLGDLVE